MKKRNIAYIIIVIVLLILVDQISKIVIAGTESEIKLIDGVLSFRYLENTRWCVWNC